MEIKMPRLGLTMTEGVVAKWHVKEGDRIEKGALLCDIESDKSVIPFESPDEGVILRLLAEPGEVIPVLEPILLFEGEDEGLAVTVKETAQVDIKEKQFVTPAARRIARENGIDVRLLTPRQGKQRIEKQDVLRVMKTGRDAAPIAAPESEPSRETRKLPLTSLRKAVARNMKESLFKAAHVSSTTEVDMTQVVMMIDRLTEKVHSEYGVKLSVNDVILKCTAFALQAYPRMNSVLAEEEILEKTEINLGMAVALADGLIVPVIQDADRLGIGTISQRAKALSQKAREGGLLPEEYAGGTFTVSNLGMFGITHFTSIINQPESAILSVGSLVKRPAAEGDQVIIKPMMNLTINYDHRLIDGAVSAQFLRYLRELLEEPLKMLL